MCYCAQLSSQVCKFAFQTIWGEPLCACIMGANGKRSLMVSIPEKPGEDSQYSCGQGEMVIDCVKMCEAHGGEL